MFFCSREKEGYQLCPSIPAKPYRTTYVFDDSLTESVPSLGTVIRFTLYNRRSKHIVFPQSVSIDRFDSWPSDEFLIDEAFQQLATKFDKA
jgi:hypothetical protein